MNNLTELNNFYKTFFKSKPSDENVKAYLIYQENFQRNSIQCPLCPKMFLPLEGSDLCESCTMWMSMRIVLSSPIKKQP